MNTNLEKAENAIKYFELAEKFEESKDWEKAIENYELGVENLKQSGYLSERVEEIYSRIAELNNIISRKKQIQLEKTQDYKDKLEGEAYALLDGAKKLESEGFLQDAIKQYMTAVTAFIKVGWTEQQLESIQTKMLALAEVVDNRRESEAQQQQAASQIIHPTLLTPHFQAGSGVFEGGVKRIETVKKFEDKKKKEQEIQDESFTHLDKARDLEQRGEFDQAIQSYELAIKLLDSIGWVDQTKNLRVAVQKIQQKKLDSERFKTQKMPSLDSETPKTKISTEIQESDKGDRIRKYQELKKKEQAIQTQAFNFLESGNRLERNGNYEEAISQFEKAVELFQSIEWHSYIQPILNFIDNVKEKHQNELQAIEIGKKRQQDLKQLQDSIYLKNKEQFVQSTQALQEKRQKFLEKRRAQLQKEQEFFTLVNKADETLQNAANLDLALHAYQQALDLIKDLGSGWETQVITIQNTIDHVQKLKESQELKLLKEKQKIEEQKREELEFQRQIAEQLEKERNRLREKELVFKEKQEDLQYLQKKKEEAFKFLDTAQIYTRKEDLDKAIHAYQNAAMLFGEIHWSEEIPLIENSITELERRKKEKQLAKQRELQKELERKKQEKALQDEISNQLELERQKIREKRIFLKEREDQLAFQEKKREEAFKFLDRANQLLNESMFEAAIEEYHSAANIFAQINWSDEVNSIQNAIIEIENKKREKNLSELKNIQQKLEKQKEEREFQAFLSNQANIEKEKLKKKTLILREREQELLFREKKKEEAFKFLDRAQKHIIEGQFQEAIDIYNNVVNIFALIQWDDEIVHLKNAIKEIEVKRYQKELAVQQKHQLELKQEIEYDNFVETIKSLKFKQETRQNVQREALIKESKNAAQIQAKQDQAFNIMAEAELLLKQKSFDKSIEKYKTAIDLLKSIGWSEPYLKTLHDGINLIAIKKDQYQKEKQRDLELEKARKDEEFLFQLKISDQMLSEQEKYKTKAIELKKKEVLLKEMEKKRLESFNLLDEAEMLLNQGKYEESIDLYKQAELYLSEIQFPTDSIKETIQKVRNKQKEDELRRIKTEEQALRSQQEEAMFQRTLVEKMESDKLKMIKRKKSIREQEEISALMENKKRKAFDMLDDAENFTKQAYYDKAFQYYRCAELALNEIHFPTDSLREVIDKVKQMKNDAENLEKRKLEEQLKQQQVELEYQDKILESTKKEQARLRFKELKLRKMEEIKQSFETRRKNAFEILDQAESMLRKNEYDGAIGAYRKASIILNEINFPTDSIKEAIVKVTKLKKAKELREERELKAELERLDEDKQLKTIIEKRQKEEQKKKIAQKQALEERERMIQEKASHREVAYQLLDKASKHLKGLMPDYDAAISLYAQARTILTENVGWEPEIKHITELIKDLQKEKTKMIQRKQLEEQAQIKRQKEYEAFQEEIRKRQLLLEQQKQEQEKNYQEIVQKRQNYDQLREQGLKLIEEGKKFASNYNFSKAYQLFEGAIHKFKQIGWNDEISYIQTEIKNTRALESKIESERRNMEELRNAVKIKKEHEKQQIAEQDKIKEVAVGEVGKITNQVTQMIEHQKKLELERAQQERERIKNEAKDFRTKMGSMIRLKQDLLSEMEKTKDLEQQTIKNLEKKKEQEHVNDIAKMIKEAAKKKKED
ncbi:MAG: hypothetical protein JW891_01860 [Candidatus Lokiarchaeota archaeon]|nr:hypothetical protein [Candidatus Lokiarchaeota archaeon]